MITIIESIIGIILTIVIVVGFHEFGHFITAKAFGIRVLTFSIGFGKALFQYTAKSGTKYVIAAIPLGGYVKMLDGREQTLEETDIPYAFDHRPWYQKAMVIAAGPLFNFLLAILLYWVIFVIGFNTILPVIDKVTPDSIAAKAGLQSQQRILEVDHTSVRSWMGVGINLIKHYGTNKNIHLKVTPFQKKRDKTILLSTKHWTLDGLEPDLLGSLGITPYVSESTQEFIRYSPLNAIRASIDETWQLSSFTVISLWKIITGELSLKSLGGPITIAEISAQAFIQGFVVFLSFLALISINLGIVNLIPIPMLDGGQFCFALTEGVLRRPLSMRIQLLFHRFGVIIIILLLFQVIMNDVMRLF